MTNGLLMPLATAVWLVENTTLTFKQIANFCNLHEVEIQGIADGEVAKGIKPYNPIISGQLTKDEISKCEKQVSGGSKNFCENQIKNAKTNLVDQWEGYLLYSTTTFQRHFFQISKIVSGVDQVAI